MSCSSLCFRVLFLGPILLLLVWEVFLSGALAPCPVSQGECVVLVCRLGPNTPLWQGGVYIANITIAVGPRGALLLDQGAVLSLVSRASSTTPQPAWCDWSDFPDVSPPYGGWVFWFAAFFVSMRDCAFSLFLLCRVHRVCVLICSLFFPFRPFSPLFIPGYPFSLAWY